MARNRRTRPKDWRKNVMRHAKMITDSFREALARRDRAGVRKSFRRLSALARVAAIRIEHGGEDKEATTAARKKKVRSVGAPAVDEAPWNTEEDRKLRRIAESARQHGIQSLEQAATMRSDKKKIRVHKKR